jgi:hypothetical protein
MKKGKNELYERLTTKKDKTLEENVFVKPLDSFETIISAVNYALTQSEEVENLIEALKKDMLECDVAMQGEPPAAEMPVIYPFLIATYTNFCLFELIDKTFKCEYAYNSGTREVKLGMPKEVVLDVTMKIKTTEDD